MVGFLVPPWYQASPVSLDDQELSSIFFGFAICQAIFTIHNVCLYTWHFHKRGRLLNTFIFLIWGEWISSVSIAFMCWFLVTGRVEPSFQIFFFLVCLWVIQIQCAPQIIINRIRLLSNAPRLLRAIKWGVAGLIGILNVIVFSTWVPARLQINETFMRFNAIFDPIEKGIFALVDLGLNIYFIYLVRTTLVKVGLTGYNALFRFNILMVVVSISMDVILIGLMFLPSTIVYVSFHPLVYLCKLHIELTITELITKIAKETHALQEQRGTQVTRPIGIRPTADDTRDSEPIGKNFVQPNSDFEHVELKNHGISASGATSSTLSEPRQSDV